MKYYLMLLGLLLVGFCNLCNATQITQSSLSQIDSLIENHKLKEAESQILDLEKIYLTDNSARKHKGLDLDIKYRKAKIFDLLEHNPTEVITILQEILEPAEDSGNSKLLFKIYLLLALSYEKADNFLYTKLYLKKAENLHKKEKLNELYSTFCIRTGSYYRTVPNYDSVRYFAELAQIYATRYGKKRDLVDSYILLKVVNGTEGKTKEYQEYNQKILGVIRNSDEYNFIAITYLDIAQGFLDEGNLETAALYTDSAWALFNKVQNQYKSLIANKKAYIHESFEQHDSALYYFKIYNEKELELLNKTSNVKAKELEIKYQNNQQLQTIKNRELQIFLILGFMGVILTFAAMNANKNRKIKSQNRLINKQLDELSKVLDQKQILLSELQHRVKNNLQHVISILELQKESVDFNNIEELIRSNQNRIHSMALIHTKLNVFENVQEVSLCKYITDLTGLVKTSYDQPNKAVELRINCKIDKISIDKAFPLGLILVELVSNSMKHAFKKQKIGLIQIDVSLDNSKQNIILFFADNGEGFDFQKDHGKGLGKELILGLVDQLDGKIETDNKNGFELTLTFK